MDNIKGFMYDVARGLKGDPLFLEDMIRRLAGYGYNMLVLQFEYRFQFPSHPSIGTADSLTPEDVRRLDQVAREHGVELVPSMNAASHCEGIGYLEAYRYLVADTTGMTSAVEQLKVNDPAVCQLITELYADLFDCFSSTYFHIGGDEIRKLSLLFPNDTEQERFAKAMEYLLFVIKLVQSKGKTAMMWGDMLLKHEGVVSQIPDDVIICDWAYYSDPILKGLSNEKSQLMFKNAGKRAIACPAVNGFFGNPVVSVNSTLNITSFYKEHREIFGADTCGVMLCSWETDRGNFFSASWPWIYMQGRLFAGDKVDGMNFLREYSRLEWGMDTNELSEWHDLNDVQVQKIFLFEAVVDEAVRKALAGTKNRPYKLLRLFITDLLRHQNILPVLSEARSWINAKVRGDLRLVLKRAASVAESLYTKATARKEEPLMLLEWNRAFLHILDLLDGIETAEQSYRAAALAHAHEGQAYQAALEACQEDFRKLAEKTGELVHWSELLTTQENNSLEETWWIRKAQLFIEQKAEELANPLHGSRGLIHFNLFIRAEIGMPYSPTQFKSARTVRA